MTRGSGLGSFGPYGESARQTWSFNPLNFDMAVVNTVLVDPILRVGEFTTHFRLPILVVGLNRMFTGDTIWILTHGHSDQPQFIHRGVVLAPP